MWYFFFQHYFVSVESKGLGVDPQTETLESHCTEKYSTKVKYSAVEGYDLNGHTLGFNPEIKR